MCPGERPGTQRGDKPPSFCTLFAGRSRRLKFTRHRLGSASLDPPLCGAAELCYASFLVAHSLAAILQFAGRSPRKQGVKARFRFPRRWRSRTSFCRWDGCKLSLAVGGKCRPPRLSSFHAGALQLLKF